MPKRWLASSTAANPKNIIKIIVLECYGDWTADCRPVNFANSRGRVDQAFAASGSFPVRWPASSLPSVWEGRREEEKGLTWEVCHVNDDSDVPCAQSPVQILLTMESRWQQETPVGDAVLVGSYKSSPYYQRTRRISPRLHLGLSRKRS